MNRRTLLSPRDRIRSALCATGMVIAATVGMVLFFGWPAKSQAMCGVWSELRKGFATLHKEVPVAAGVALTAMIVVVASDEGKTFTVFVVDKNGIGCAIAAGTDWQTKPERGF